MKYLTLFMLFAVIVLCSASFSFAADTIAVLDFKSLLADEDLGIAVAEILRTELASLGDYTVIERGMLEQILEEQALQSSGAIDSETAAEIGKLLGANLVVTGSIVKTGDVYTINSRFIDMETGIIKTGQNIRGEGENEISNMVHQLALVITGRTIVSEEAIVTPTPQETTPVEPDSSESEPSAPDAQQQMPPVSQPQSMPSAPQTLPPVHVLFSFENPQDVKQWRIPSSSQVQIKRSKDHVFDGEYALHVTFPKSNNPQGLTTDQIPADWSAYSILGFQAHLTSRKPNQTRMLWVMIDDQQSEQGQGFAKEFPLHSGSNTIRIGFDEIRQQIDLASITRLSFATRNNPFPLEVTFDGIVLSAAPQGVQPGQPQFQPGPPEGGDFAPPQEALIACAGKRQGDVCQFTTPRETVRGTCQKLPNQQIACAPAGGPPQGGPPQGGPGGQRQPPRR